MSGGLLPPAAVDLVVVGGGVLGASVAWHFARLGGTVTLFEREAIGAAATSRSAALLTRARSRPEVVPLVARTYQAIEELEAELAESLGLRRQGSLHAAAAPEQVKALRELVAGAEAAGLEARWIAPAEAAGLAPWLAPAALRACALMPGDGFLDPYLLASAYARAARRAGARVCTGVEVLGLLRDGGRIAGVETSGGAVRARAVALAAGAWSGGLAWPAGVGLAMAPVRSQYWITERGPLFPRRMPTVVLPDAGAFARPELGGLLFGLREHASMSLDGRSLPSDPARLPLGEPGGWEALGEGAPVLSRFFPALEQVGIAHHVAGLSTYTPDGQFLVGPVASAPGLLVASGCCGAGVAASGGIGLAVASLAAGRRPPFDLAPFAPDRFGAVDPFSAAFRERCEQARSRKRSG